MSLVPFDFHGWLKENESKLKPPVGNAIVAEGEDYQVMVVGGPNARSDFHLNQTEASAHDRDALISHTRFLSTFYASLPSREFRRKYMDRDKYCEEMIPS
ncbi:3-hydroxyanthranilic acid dioxygenase, partial [Spiromyces aspiralis]